MLGHGVSRRSLAEDVFDPCYRYRSLGCLRRLEERLRYHSGQQHQPLLLGGNSLFQASRRKCVSRRGARDARLPAYESRCDCATRITHLRPRVRGDEGAFVASPAEMVRSAGLRLIEAGALQCFGDSAVDGPTSQFSRIRSGSVRNKKKRPPSTARGGPALPVRRTICQTHGTDGTESKRACCSAKSRPATFPPNPPGFSQPRAVPRRGVLLR